MQLTQALPHLEDRTERNDIAGRLHGAIMHHDSGERDQVLPFLIPKLTPFIAGPERDEMLVSILRETILLSRDQASAAPILQALAAHLGNFRPATQPVVAEEIRTAALAMPRTLGEPILATLGMQQACSDTARSRAEDSANPSATIPRHTPSNSRDHQ